MSDGKWLGLQIVLSASKFFAFWYGGLRVLDGSRSKWPGLAVRLRIVS